MVLIIYGFEISIFFYTSLGILFARIIIYSLILYLIFVAFDFYNLQPFKKYFFAAIFIVLGSRIAIQLLGLLLGFFISIMIVLLVFAIFLRTELDKAIFFIIVIIFLELPLELSVVPILENHFYNEEYYPIDIKSCLQKGGIDMYNKSSIYTKGRYYYDFCSKSKWLKDKNKVESCFGKNCYLVKYTCDAKEMFKFYPCPNGCRDGACII